MTCGVVSYDQLDPARPLDWVLERGWFDCQLGAALIVAVCRARGVPARLAGGYLLYPTAPAVHYWAEVWLEDCGWAPFDLLTWGLSRGGRDRLWRDHFFGRLDHRMTTQRLPRLFSGAGSVRLPNAWRILARGADEGIQADLYDARSGELTYQEFVAVQLQDHA
jgi:hypothetical protein